MEFTLNDTLGSFDTTVPFRGAPLEVRITNEEESELDALATATVAFLNENTTNLKLQSLIHCLRRTTTNGATQTVEDLSFPEPIF